MVCGGKKVKTSYWGHKIPETCPVFIYSLLNLEMDSYVLGYLLNPISGGDTVFFAYLLANCLSLLCIQKMPIEREIQELEGRVYH